MPVIVRLLLLLGASSVFALGFWRIECPGLYYDEVFFVAGWYPDGSFAWRPGGFPLMQLPYLGGLKTLMYWPVANQLSVALIRVPPLVAAALSIGLTFCTVRRLAGRRAAWFTAALLAVDPAFIFLQRLDWGPVAMGILLMSATLLLLVQWRDQGGAWRLPVAGLLVGLGLYDKITFAWFVFGLCAGWLATRDRWPRARAVVMCAGIVGVILGAAPLIAFNVVTPSGTVGSEVLGSREWHAVERIPMRVQMIADTFSGRRLYDMVNRASLRSPIACPGLPGSWAPRLCGAFPLDGSWLPAALGAALIATLFSPPLRRDFACRLLGTLVVATAAVFLPLALGTASGLVVDVGPHHAAVLAPLVEMFVVVVMVRAMQLYPSWRVPIAAALALVLISSAAVSVRTAATFTGTCGRGPWSPAIYQARDFVERRPEGRFLLGDWGFYTQLRALAPGAWLDDVSWAVQRGDVDPARFRPTADARTFLLLHRREAAVFPSARRRALSIVRRTGSRIRRVRRLRDLDGRPIGDIVEILSVPAGQRSG